MFVLFTTHITTVTRVGNDQRTVVTAITGWLIKLSIFTNTSSATLWIYTILIMVHFVLNVTKNGRAFLENYRNVSMILYKMYTSIGRYCITFVNAFRWFTVLLHIFSGTIYLCSIHRIHTPTLAVILEALQWMKSAHKIALQLSAVVETRSYIRT